MRFSEITEAIQAKTPAQTRVDALKAGVDRAKAALAAERQRQKLTTATQRLRQVSAVKI